MQNIQVLSGDITRVKSDALITAINSSGAWFGNIDSIIQRAAGQLFHKQAREVAPLTDGQTIVALHDKSAHDGAFANVVFVVDDLQKPLSEVIYKGLYAASAAGFSHVTLPTIRMGVMLGVVEKSSEEAVDQMVIGIKKFKENHPSLLLKKISFVVYNDATTEKLLKKALLD